MILDQQTVDRPDLVAHVFYQKQQALLWKIHDGYFGKLSGMVYTIEYQKRGLPHMHLLIFLAEEDKPHTVEQINGMISAQIPDQELFPALYQAVSKYMIHDCSPGHCLEHGVCKKCFPKSFNVQTILKDDGYPEYAWPNNGHTVQKGEKTYNNTHVVPRPRELIVEFNSHINLEVYATIKAIKYVHKYIYKEPDHATLQVQGHNEIKAYLNSHYISAVEAAWCIFEFKMHLENASVYCCKAQSLPGLVDAHTTPPRHPHTSFLLLQ